MHHFDVFGHVPFPLGALAAERAPVGLEGTRHFARLQLGVVLVDVVFLLSRLNQLLPRHELHTGLRLPRMHLSIMLPDVALPVAAPTADRATEWTDARRLGA